MKEQICIESAQANAGIMRGGCPTLNASHENPILICSEQYKIGTTPEEREKEKLTVTRGGFPNEATTRNPVLRLLWKGYGAEAVVKWGVAVMAALQQSDILQSGVHESCVPGKTENGNKLDGCTLPRPEVVAKWALRDLREQQECGCSPQRLESREQFPRQFAETLPELPHESPQTAKKLFDMWEAGEGIGILQQTLHQIQEIWESTMGERKRGGEAMKSVVRRLTPLE